MSGGSVTLFGADYSVYTRTARLVLEEKGVPYSFQPVDIFADNVAPEYLARHPFRKIPAFEHGDVRLYETGAISRYVDDSFDGTKLQPADARSAAHMNQAISILDAYGYRALVWDVFVERVRVPQQGSKTDEGKVRSGLEMSSKVLAVLHDIRGEDQWLAGPTLSLADCYAYPMIVLFTLAPEGREMMERHTDLREWFKSFGARESARATMHPLETNE